MGPAPEGGFLQVIEAAGNVFLELWERGAFEPRAALGGGLSRAWRRTMRGGRGGDKAGRWIGRHWGV